MLTPQQRETIKAEYSTTTAQALAKKLKIDVQRVYNFVWHHGLKKRYRHTDKRHQQLRRLHKQGLTDREIAEQLSITHDVAKSMRRRQGLALNRDVEGRKKCYQTQKQRLGFQNLNELRARAYRQFALESGWPEDLGLRETAVLNLLAASGVPMSRQAIVLGLGYQKCDKRSLMTRKPGGSVLAYLARRGLVSRLPRAHTVRGRGRGHSGDLYCLGQAALEILQRRSNEQEG